MATQLRSFGNFGENLAAKFLASKGFKVKARNFNTRFGEVDIVAQKGEIVSFVEVKTRAKTYFPISQVVTRAKQERIVKAAKCYIRDKKIINKVLRFDVITVVKSEKDYKVEHIQNAFWGK
ncbi:YraN family protein [Candidatus Dependentiae bacterium]